MITAFSTTSILFVPTQTFHEQIEKHFFGNMALIFQYFPAPSLFYQLKFCHGLMKCTQSWGKGELQSYNSKASMGTLLFVLIFLFHTHRATIMITYQKIDNISACKANWGLESIERSKPYFRRSVFLFVHEMFVWAQTEWRLLKKQ